MIKTAIGPHLTGIWRAPQGSQSIIEGIGDTVYITPDVPGTYVIELTLSDGLETSATVTTRLEVVASRSVLEVGTAMVSGQVMRATCPATSIPL